MSAITEGVKAGRHHLSRVPVNSTTVSQFGAMARTAAHERYKTPEKQREFMKGWLGSTQQYHHLFKDYPTQRRIRGVILECMRCGSVVEVEYDMKDVESRIIVHDQGILPQGFTAVRAVFRETLNACPLEMFVSDDEHGGSFLTSSTPFAGTLREKYTSRACSTGLFRGLVLPQRTSATIRTPLVIKYAKTPVQTITQLPLPVPENCIIVHCFSKCTYVTQSDEPQEAHDLMEKHYDEKHRRQIDRIIGRGKW